MKNKNILLFLLLIIFIFSLSFNSTIVYSQKTTDTLKTKKIYTLPEGSRIAAMDEVYNYNAVEISKNLQRIALLIRTKGNKFMVVLDGKVIGKDYDNVYPFFGIPGSYEFPSSEKSFRFSPDSKNLAYVAKKQGKDFVVLNGKEGKKYDEIGYLSLTFSPDSKNIAYIAYDQGKQFIVLNGKEEKKYDVVYNLTFSPDSKNIAYIAYDQGKDFVVLNGKKGKKYDYIDRLIFSPDSKNFVYKFGKNCSEYPYNIFCSSYSLVLNNKELGKYYDDIYYYGFDPTNKYLVYFVRSKNEIWRIVKKITNIK